jgi:hypothetical protein
MSIEFIEKLSIADVFRHSVFEDGVIELEIIVAPLLDLVAEGGTDSREMMKS